MELVTDQRATSFARVGIEDKVVTEPKIAANKIQTDLEVKKSFTRKEIENLHAKRAELDKETNKLSDRLRNFRKTQVLKIQPKKYFGTNELKESTTKKLKQITNNKSLLEPISQDKLNKEAKNTNLLTSLSLLLGGGLGYFVLVTEQDEATKNGFLKSPEIH